VPVVQSVVDVYQNIITLIDVGSLAERMLSQPPISFNKDD
jgi:hypothetical protein